ncbi:MAG: amidohydrolase family protein [Janthinobacterium lividum]
MNSRLMKSRLINSRQIVSHFACAALLVSTVNAFAAAPDTPHVMLVHCGKLMSSAADPIAGPTDMVVTDGKITAIGQHLMTPAGAAVLDLSSYTVVPGFIDSHIHLWTGARTPGSSPSYGLQTLRAQKAMKYALTSGVLAVRVLGTDGFIDVALRDAIDEGSIPGPRILPAGHPISIPGGHSDSFTYPATTTLDASYTPLQGIINSPEDAEKAVHLQIKYGARVIKIMASGGVGSPLDSPTAEQLSPAEMRVIVEQAHMDHLQVCAHDENAKAIMDALEAGIDSLEHASELLPPAITLMKQHHTWWDPTVYVVDNIVLGGDKGPEHRIRKGKALAATHFTSFKLGLSSGLASQMLAGSDMQYEPGTGTVLDEMITMVKYGATPKQALIAGTLNGAAALEFNDMGALKVGNEADFVALEGDPLQDIQMVKKTKAVVFRGQVVIDPAKPGTSTL